MTRATENPKVSKGQRADEERITHPAFALAAAEANPEALGLTEDAMKLLEKKL